MGIKIDYLFILKIINDYDDKQDLTLDILHQKTEKLNEKMFEKWTRQTFYSVIRTLKAQNYLKTNLTKNQIPPALIIKITQEGQEVLRYFEKGKKEIKKEVIKKEMLDLDKEKLEKMVKRVAVKMIDGVNKDEEDFSKEGLDKIKKTAKEIIEYVREK